MEGDDVLDALMVMDSGHWKKVENGVFECSKSFSYYSIGVDVQIVCVTKGTRRTLEEVAKIELTRHSDSVLIGLDKMNGRT